MGKELNDLDRKTKNLKQIIV